MKTLHPLRGFNETAKEFHSVFLRQQLMDTKRILELINSKLVIVPQTAAPAVRMWKPYANVLTSYGASLAFELKKRNKDEQAEQALARFAEIQKILPACDWPGWLGNPAFNISHQAWLKRKFPTFYDYEVDEKLPYLYVIDGSMVMEVKNNAF